MTSCIIRCLLLFCNSLAVVHKEGRRPNLQLKLVCFFHFHCWGGGGKMRLAKCVLVLYRSYQDQIIKQEYLSNKWLVQSISTFNVLLNLKLTVNLKKFFGARYLAFQYRIRKE